MGADRDPYLLKAKKRDPIVKDQEGWEVRHSHLWKMQSATDLQFAVLKCIYYTIGYLSYTDAGKTIILPPLHKRRPMHGQQSVCGLDGIRIKIHTLCTSDC